MAEPAHFVEVEGTTERVRAAAGVDGVRLHWPSGREVGGTRYVLEGVADDEGVAELRALGLDVRIVEEAQARAERLDTMGKQIREASEE